VGDASERRPWTEGPDEESPPRSWLLLDDDELLHRIETFNAREHEDRAAAGSGREQRHFFIAREAAKRVQVRSRLFAFEATGTSADPRPPPTRRET